MVKNEGVMIIGERDHCPDTAVKLDSLPSESRGSVINTDGRKSDFNFHLTEGSA